MRYFGGKQRIATALVNELIQPLLDSGDYNRYVEPFAGSCNVISKVRYGDRVASDIDEYIISTLMAAQEGFTFPSFVSEQSYLAIKENPASVSWALAGFVGYGCSYGGKWFGGYARDSFDRNYAAEAKRSLEAKGKLLQGVRFEVGSYEDMVIKPYDLVYCDIPYAGTTGYSSGDFDHKAFYEWCIRTVNNTNSTILVSEYEQNAIAAGYGDRIVWKRQAKQDMKSANGKRKETVEVVIRFN